MGNTMDGLILGLGNSDEPPIVGVYIDSRLGSKAHPSQPGGLSEAGLRYQLNLTRSALHYTSPSQKLSEYFLHSPDTASPLLESLHTMHAFIEEGHIRAWGMSNYHADEVRRAIELCAEHGLTPPSVYQGLYNPLNRAVEDDLLPLLKEHKIRS